VPAGNKGPKTPKATLLIYAPKRHSPKIRNKKGFPKPAKKGFGALDYLICLQKIKMSLTVNGET
jgi:hypothetical protein